MDITVLFSTYKRDQILRNTLNSFCNLKTDGLSWELLIADNAGLAETEKIVREYENRLPVSFYVETNPGKNSALNTLLPKARGDLFVFTDDDILPEPDWLFELYAGAQRWSGYSVFGGRILPHFDEHVSPLPTDNPFFNGVYVCADWQIDEGPYSAGDVWGPNMAIRAKLFDQGFKFNEEIGPNGTDYIMGSETELTMRLSDSGYPPVYLPKALVHHQIREEQLNPSWVKGRFYRIGRADVFNNGVPDCVLIGGVPRFFYRRLAENFLGMVNPFFPKKKRLAFSYEYYRIKGKCFQSRIRHKM